MFTFIFAIVYFIIASILVIASFIVEVQLDDTYAFFVISLLVIIFTFIFAIIFYWLALSYENILVILIVSTLLIIVFILSCILYIVKQSNFTYSIIVTSGLICMIILYLMLLRVNDFSIPLYDAQVLAVKLE